MLSIYFGQMEEAIYFPPVYFDNQYEDEWITDEFSVKMIKDVDLSDVVGARLIQSPVLGPISTKELSGGVKTLILSIDVKSEDEKVDIEKLKVDIRNEKVDFESRLLKKTKGFSTKTIAHIHRMFEQFGYDRIFGRSAIVEL